MGEVGELSASTVGNYLSRNAHVFILNSEEFSFMPICLFASFQWELCSLFTTPTLHCKCFPSLYLRAGEWDTLESMLREHFILETLSPPIVQSKQHNLQVLAAGYQSPRVFFPQFISVSKSCQTSSSSLSLKIFLATNNTAFCINCYFTFQKNSLEE